MLHNRRSNNLVEKAKEHNISIAVAVVTNIITPGSVNRSVFVKEIKKLHELFDLF